jgi:hypothetical protein
MADRKYRLSQVKILFDQMARHGRRQELYDTVLFDPISSDIIWLILNQSHNSPGDSITMSSYHISKILHTTRKRVRTRLVKLCTFGLVKVVSEWRNDGTNKRTAMTITPSPYLVHIMQTDTKPATRLAAIKHFINLGLDDRLKSSDEDLQGFNDTCLYGDSNEEQISTGDVSQKLNELVELESTSKARKIKEQMKWREYDAGFVSACANIWVFGQSKMGHGTARPNWDGETKDLAPSAQRERRELTKTFRQYGGKIAALSWYIFSCGVPKLDKNGKPIFDLNAPHRQFATIDKRPATFTKYFNAILKDSFFQKFARKDWETVGAALREYFGDLIDIGPEDGETERDKLGYIIGNDELTVEDVQ